MKAIIEFEGKKYEAELTEIQQEKESKVWKPKKGDTYYLYSDDGICLFTVWREYDEDINRYLFGNCYRTKQECQDAIDIRKTEAVLMRYAKKHNEFEFDWKDIGQKKYYIQFNHRTDDLDIDCNFYHERDSIYFTSIKIAENVIKEIGEERIKKYIRLRGQI